MKPAVDQERAERAIATLKRVQFSPVTTAITELAILSRDLGPRTVYGNQRHDAFVEIQKLREALVRFPNSTDVGALWESATAKADAWRQWLLS
ncbi:MAG: hypothetical protein WAM77_18300 [Xanthobacteraceae bacterium]